jgi:hypothetical protein
MRRADPSMVVSQAYLKHSSILPLALITCSEMAARRILHKEHPSAADFDRFGRLGKVGLGNFFILPCRLTIIEA